MLYAGYTVTTAEAYGTKAALLYHDTLQHDCQLIWIIHPTVITRYVRILYKLNDECHYQVVMITNNCHKYHYLVVMITI